VGPVIKLIARIHLAEQKDAWLAHYRITALR
jgi:hypothetical protein